MKMNHKKINPKKIDPKKINHRQSGFSLIELMIAMLIGLILLLGLVSIFTNSSTLNRAQTGLSRLQENGRFAITRIKQDLEQAGHRHCVSVSLPSAFTTNWDQGYDMSNWYVARNVNFTNGLPNVGDIQLDSTADQDQLGDSPTPVTSNIYPLDPRFFIMGHECSASSCDPAVAGGSTLGADWSTDFRNIGTTDDSRAASTDILTVRYLTGGSRIDSVAGNVVTLADPTTVTTGDALVADCNTSMVDQASWAGTTVTTSNTLPAFDVLSDARVYSLDEDFKTVSYYIGIDTDPGDSSRVISSLYRSENGVSQQIIEGVERMDFYYLAQLQTGHVARLTADEVQAMVGGGDVNNDGLIDGTQGCIIPPLASLISGFSVANDAGCLWRSIYAIEVHLLLNTVTNSSTADNESFIYSPDGQTPQNPASGLQSGLPHERMYRREFTTVVPIRSYTL